MSYLINSSFGPGEFERATVPFTIAITAANTGTSRMFLTCDALNLVKRGGADGPMAPGYAPVKDLIDAFVQKGGRMWVCAGFMGLTQDDPIDGAEIGGAPDTMAFVAEEGGRVLM